MNTRPTNLVIDSGGILGAAYIGALMSLDLSNVSRVMGVSIGSVAATMLALGSTTAEMQTEFMKLDPSLLSDTTIIPALSVKSCGGRCKGRYVYDWIGAILNKRMGTPDATFGDIYRVYGKELVVVATRVRVGEPRYFNTYTDTTMPVRLAVRMSCAIPFMYEYISYNGNIYYDGAFCTYSLYAYFRQLYVNKGIVGDAITDTIALSISHTTYPITGTGIGLVARALIAQSCARTITNDTPQTITLYLAKNKMRIDAPKTITDDAIADVIREGFYSAKKHIRTYTACS